mmetsp:Transcript_925/g.2130  ORF Transcript_925/g.2130 Transcript_925/m.2130 type:complete len:88 (-) Transcript_925:1556-1819(-)
MRSSEDIDNNFEHETCIVQKTDRAPVENTKDSFMRCSHMHNGKGPSAEKNYLDRHTTSHSCGSNPQHPHHHLQEWQLPQWTTLGRLA